MEQQISLLKKNSNVQITRPCVCFDVVLMSETFKKTGEILRRFFSSHFFASSLLAIHLNYGIASLTNEKSGNSNKSRL